MSLNENQVYVRQRDIYVPSAHNVPVTIVGCGSLGSWAAVSLAKLGLTDFTLYDPDVVEPHNLPNQYFSPSSVGKNKAVELRTALQNCAPAQINNITVFESPFQKENKIDSGLVINVSDSVEVRRLVYSKCLPSCFIIDARTGVENFTVLTCDKSNPDDRHRYQASFFKDSEAEETGCRVRATGHMSTMVSSVITSTWVRRVNNEPYPRVLSFDMRSWNLYTDLINVEEQSEEPINLLIK